MNVTLDGFMSGPDCELDWHFRMWSNEMAEEAGKQLARADTIILGGITYRAMAKYWPLQATSLACAREDIAFADMMNNYTKVVFSKTIQAAQWHNTKLVRSGIAKEIGKLKQQPGKHLMVYGSGKIVAALMHLNLIDEYQVWLHPVVLGKGKPFFKDLNNQLEMDLLGTTSFRCGVVLLNYLTSPRSQIPY